MLNGLNAILPGQRYEVWVVGKRKPHVVYRIDGPIGALVAPLVQQFVAYYMHFWGHRAVCLDVNGETVSVEVR